MGTSGLARASARLPPPLPGRFGAQCGAGSTGVRIDLDLADSAIPTDSGAASRALRCHLVSDAMIEIDRHIAAIQAQMDLDSETQHEILEEIRSHLEEAVERARELGLDEHEALATAAERAGMDQAGLELQKVHVGWGTADAVIAAGLPVLCALVLRWMVFAPGGTALGWQRMLVRPAFWAIATVALVLPLLKFGRWRYGLASWAFFWAITIVFAAMPSLLW